MEFLLNHPVDEINESISKAFLAIIKYHIDPVQSHTFSMEVWGL